ncbi:MAG: hypothetical protein WA828_09570 [Coleofasciculaceae cyanobacterium]
MRLTPSTVSLPNLLISVLVAAASSLLATAAKAQTNSNYGPIRVETIPEAINRSFYQESGDIYRNSSIQRQIGWLIGPGLPGRAGFPDLQIERDARRVNILYRDALEQQVSSGPIIRTPDLPNPFNSTLRQQTGAGRFGTRLEGSEFNFQTLPPQ